MDNNKPIPQPILLIIPALILGAVYILAGLIPFESLWGFNHLKYFPDYVPIIYAVLFLLIALPYISNNVIEIIGGLMRKFQALPPLVRIIIIGAGSAVVFYFLRVHVHSLGDGYQRIYQIEKGYWYYHTEPLDFFLHAVLYRVLKLFSVYSGELSYTIISISAGAVFVIAVYLLKFPDNIPTSNINLIKVLAVSLGGMQMFFGYVESYTFYYLFGLLFLIWAIRFILSDTGIMAASILLALAIASHITAMFLLPPYVYLTYFNLKKTNPKTFVQKYLPSLIVLLVIFGHIAAQIRLKFFVDIYTPSFGAEFLPFVSASEYAMISPIHFYDILNQLLLIIPALFLMLFYFIPNIKFDSNRKTLNRFLGLSVICAVLVIFIVDPKLGYARDWDLFSIPTAVLGLTLATLFLLGLSGKERVNSRTVFMIASFSILFFSGWILTNASEKRQLHRAEDLLGLSEKGRGYSTELLAHYYRSSDNDSEKSLELLEGITGPAKNARVYGKIAKAQMDLQRFDDALKSAYNGIALDSSDTELQLMAGFLWLKKERPELALPRLLKANELAPNRPEILRFLCTVYTNLDSLGKAILIGHEVIRIRPEYAPAYIDLGEIYFRMRVFDSAMVYTKKGLKLDPSISTGYEILEDIRNIYQQSRGR